MNHQPLLIEQRRDEGVAVLTLNRPEQRNALSLALRTALSDALRALAGDDAVRAVVLSGRGEVFCAGFDLNEMAVGDPRQVFAQARGYHRALHTFPKPLIAAVNGSAMAGGMDLAALCDIRLAVDTAAFGQPQVRRGIPAAWDLMRSVLPEPQARLMCLSGRRLAARELVACGFLVDVYPDRSALMDAALALAADCAASTVSATLKRQFVTAQPDLFGKED